MKKRRLETFKTVKVEIEAYSKEIKVIVPFFKETRKVTILECCTEKVYIQTLQYPFLNVADVKQIVVEFNKSGCIRILPDYCSANAVEDFFNNPLGRCMFLNSFNNYYWSVCTFKPTITFLCCMKKLSKLPKDVYKIIATDIYNSEKDLRWFL